MLSRFDDISLSVIVPTLNESANIVRFLEETAGIVRSHFSCRFFELLVVDDDSPDGTYRLAAGSGDPAVRVLRRMSDHGLRNSIEEGVREARGDVVLWLDGDFSHPPQYIPQLVAALYVGFDIAVNSRYVAGGEDVREGKGTLLQRALSQTLNRIIWLLLGHSFRDYTSGFVAARTEIVRKLGLRGDYGEYFIDFIYRAIRSGKRIIELPYRNEPRAGGESKTGSNLLDYTRRGLRYLALLAEIRLHGGVNERTADNLRQP